jgi:hypothetical protein
MIISTTTLVGTVYIYNSLLTHLNSCAQLNQGNINNEFWKNWRKIGEKLQRKIGLWHTYLTLR